MSFWLTAFCLALVQFAGADYASTVHNLFTSLKRDFGPMHAPVNGTIPAWVDVDRYANGFGKVRSRQLLCS